MFVVGTRPFDILNRGNVSGPTPLTPSFSGQLAPAPRPVRRTDARFAPARIVRKNVGEKTYVALRAMLKRRFLMLIPSGSETPNPFVPPVSLRSGSAINRRPKNLNLSDREWSMRIVWLFRSVGVEEFSCQFPPCVMGLSGVRFGVGTKASTFCETGSS